MSCLPLVVISELTLLSGAANRIFWTNWVNTMAADALAPCIARSSATMVLTVQGKWIFVFHEDEFQLPTPSQWWVMIKYVNIHWWYLKINSGLGLITVILLYRLLGNLVYYKLGALRFDMKIGHEGSWERCKIWLIPDVEWRSIIYYSLCELALLVCHKALHCGNC